MTITANRRILKIICLCTPDLCTSLHIEGQIRERGDEKDRKSERAREVETDIINNKK